MIPAFTKRALAGEPLSIAGDGSQSRRLVYVEDLADGVVRALAPVDANRTYNLVGGEDTTVLQIAEAVRDVVGEVEIVHGPGHSGDFAGAPAAGSARRDLVAFSGWTGAALAAVEFAGVRGETVLVPSNTFMATPLARHRPRAVMLVHIGGHLAFESERIAELCRAEASS